MIRTLFTAVLLVLLLPVASAVAGEVDSTQPAGLVAVGDPAPSMTLTDAASGVELRLESLRGEKDLVAVFFRGAW